MLICFEGPRKSGKTTLARMLSKRLGIPIWDRPVEIETFKEKTKAYDLFVLDELSILNRVDWSKQDLIVDRHPAVSEWVYSLLYDRKSLVERTVDLIPNNTCFIFLSRNWRDLEKKEEQSIYDGVMFKVKERAPVLVLRTDIQKEQECLEMIVEFLDKLRGGKRDD